MCVLLSGLLNIEAKAQCVDIELNDPGFETWPANNGQVSGWYTPNGAQMTWGTGAYEGNGIAYLSSGGMNTSVTVDSKYLYYLSCYVKGEVDYFLIVNTVGTALSVDGDD